MAKAMDWEHLLPSEYVRLVNSTEAGPECTNRRRVGRMRDTYGMKVTDAQGKINIFKALPIRFERLLQVIDKPKFDKAAWEQERDRERRAKIADIGKIPQIPKFIQLPDGTMYPGHKLRDECDASLYRFAEICHPDVLYLPMSDDHWTMVADIETVLDRGGKRAKAYQRGFGKTAWCKLGMEWGGLTGRTDFVFLIGKSESEAYKIQRGIKRAFETNKMIRQLYPEVGYVMHLLSKNPRGNHTYKGEVLKCQQIEDLFVLPYLKGSPSSELVFGCSGIFGGYRGAHFEDSDGNWRRVKHVMLDDPQDDTMARNPETVAKVLSLLRGAIEELGGPGRKMGIVVPCTCIKDGCFASQITDRMGDYADYLGVRQPAMDSLPTCLDPDNELGLPRHWERYVEIRKQELAQGEEEHPMATEYYREHHEEMNHGASVRWRERFEWPHIDALQELMHMYFDKRDEFFAEFQQDPQDKSAAANYLNEQQLAHCFNGLDRGQIPDDVYKLTAAIDLQEDVLYWMVIGWAKDLTGYIIAHGTTPDQPPGRFAHQNVQRRIPNWIAQQDPENAHTWESERELALTLCCDLLLQGFPRDGKNDMIVDTIFVDARWPKVDDLCRRVAATEKYRGIVVPAGGQYVGPNAQAISRKRLQKGQARVDRNCEWYMDNVAVDVDGNGKFVVVKQVEFDANFYRTHVQKALAKNLKKGDGKPKRGRISYHGQRPNKFLASHFAAKSVELKPGNRRDLEVWIPKPNRDQDHWLDTLVMCRIAAEYEGLRLESQEQPRTGSAKTRQVTQADVPFRN